MPFSVSFDMSDDTRVNQVDRRKFNRGQKNRKSYSKDIKERSIALRANGLSVEEIAKILDTAKSNIEKWCSYKVLLSNFNFKFNLSLLCN